MFDEYGFVIGAGLLVILLVGLVYWMVNENSAKLR